MLIARKARPAAVGILAALVLTGCAASTDSAPSDAPSNAPKVQSMPDQRPITILDIIDPVTIVVTPADSADELYGEEFTVHVSGMIAPVEGECGFDESLAAAKDALNGPRSLAYESEPEGGQWIDDAGDHYGFIQSAGIPYIQQMIIDGMAVPTEEWRPSYEGNQVAAQDADRGLWAICPDFGA